MFFGEHKKPIGTCVQTDDFAPRGDLSVAEHRTLWWRFFNSVPAVDLVLLPSQFLPHFLEVFAKLAGAIISIVMSVRPSVCVCVCVSPHETNKSAPTARIFMKFDIWIFFENLLRKFTFHYIIKYDDPLTWGPMNIYDNISLTSSENEKIFQTKITENIQTHILSSVTFYKKSCLLWNNVEIYGRAREANR